MQSDPKDRFSRLSTTVLWVVSIIVLVWLFFVLQDSVRTPTVPGSLIASSTPTASTTSVSTSTAMSSAAASSSPRASAPELNFNLSVKSPGGVIHAAISATESEREQGLSDQARLPKDSGMLFVFQSAGVYGFWMKDMNFPIDMVWIGADKIVSGVAPGVSPSSYPQVFYPSAPISYVLELASGEAAKMRIAPGTKLVF